MLLLQGKKIRTNPPLPPWNIATQQSGSAEGTKSTNMFLIYRSPHVPRPR